MSPTPSPRSPIAIVGIAAQLPSGDTALQNLDHNQFFDFLLNKGEAYESIPLERFNIDSYFGAEAGRVSTKYGTFLKHTDQLDHVELGITNKDAKAMSVSTRKLIELSFLALLDSGIDYRGQNVGCFTSGIVFDVLSLSEPDEFEAKGSFGGPPAMIANRVSYHLDLVGPSIPVDTACSSSLTATHMAVQAIRAGDCDAAVVGGIQLNHRFVDWVQYSQGGILSPDGKCKPFDASANGFSRGEAGVVIVLKRLDQAIKDKDHIYATILGTGINSSGSAAPVNAPVAAAQRDAMQRAWSQTGRDPREVDFVELHATGTAAGDPTEANWVGDAFHRDEELVIGSVKGNIGHTEIAAFLASLTKVINIFRTGIIPPNVNFSAPNPRIHWDEYRLRVPTESIPLPCHSASGRSLVSLCGSGIGGANGHVVLEAPPAPATNPVHMNGTSGQKPLLLMAGGLSPRSATAISESITELIVAQPDKAPLLATIYGRRSRQMPWRSFAVCAGTSSEQIGKVKFSTPTLVPRVKPPIVFVFAGQGPQHLDMGCELFEVYPAFRESILEMDDVYARATGVSLISTTGLFDKSRGGASSTRLADVWPIKVTLPALAMLQCALVDLMASFGVTPEVVVGHSAGETAVLYASGAGSKAMVVELAIARGQAMALVEEAGGTMAALSCGVDDAKYLIVQALEPALRSTVDVACHNSREAVTISGLASSIDRVVALAKSREIAATKLRTRVPVHSKMMELCRVEFERLVEEMWSRYPDGCRPRLPVYSTLTGDLFDGVFTGDYYWTGTRDAVLFTEAISALLEEYPAATFVEVSPHPVLSSYLSALGAAAVVSPLRRPKRNEREAVEVATFLEGLGRLTVLGQNVVDFSAVNEDPAHVDVTLPAYPFVPKSVPYHSESASYYRQFAERRGPLNSARLRVNAQTHPVLAQHVIKGEPIMPAAGFLEMALEFGAMELWGVEFRAMMSLSGEMPAQVEVRLDGTHWTIKTATASASARKHESTFDKVHAEGYLSLDVPKAKYASLNIRSILGRCRRIDLTHFYEDLKTFAEYGPEFQRVIDAYEGEDEVLVLVRGDDDTLDIEGYRFHPAILDCCLHFMVHKSFTLNTDPNVYYLPSKVGKLVVHPALAESGLPDRLYAHIVFKAWTPETLVADFRIVAIDGTPLCTLTDVEIERHESSPRVPPAQRYDVVLQPLSGPEMKSEEHIFGASAPEDMRRLYLYLDNLASQVIVGTLRNGPTTGSELDRKRYKEFSSKVAASFVPTDTFDAATVTEIYQKWPEMIEVTNRVASCHGKIFETSKAAVGVLYKDDLMTRFYKHYDWASAACADRFRSLASAMIESGKRVIKVLEVGAGTGALTRHLTRVMDEFPSTIFEFVVSDVSKEFLPRTTDPRCRYKAFDLSKPPISQGFSMGSFDVIAGFHVLHVVADMTPSLRTLNDLLVPGGSLIIGDLNGDSWESRTPGTIWFDFVFGSFAEWFAFTDDRSHCTMSIPSWRERLQTAGFGRVLAAGSSGDPLLFTLVAQKHHRAVQRISAPRNYVDKRVLHYRQGEEGQLRSMASKHDASNISLWLYAHSGFHGDAGMGFVRSLAREYPLWDIHLFIFDGSWSESRMSDFVVRHSSTPGFEPVLFVDKHGKISVPRVVPSIAPSGQLAFKPSLPWVLSESRLVQTSLSPGPDSATVNVLAMSPREGSLCTFVGRVSSVPSSAFVSANDLVVGLVSSQGLSNMVTVHHQTLARLPKEAQGLVTEIAGALLGMVIGCLACGVSTLRSPRRQQGKNVLLTHGSDSVTPTLRWFLQLLGYDVIEARFDSPGDLAKLASQVDLVISGTDNRMEMQTLRSGLANGRRIFMWNDSQCGLKALLDDDPLVIGEALDFAIERVAGYWPHNTIGLRLSEVPIPDAGTLVPSSSSLFDPHKAYLLVGGLGGVGIRVALWMYEKGARYLILTSRSGRESLARVQDRLALRIIGYLESLPDLTIRLESCDATSKQATTSLLRSISLPIGGCMLLTVVLSDRTFAFQEDEDVRKVFASKTGACSVLESCLPGGISALDFFIPFSSVVGLFGNGGQTNYSSANAALDGMVRNWDNAFTFILPAVTDGGGLASETRDQGGRLGHLTPWGMSSQHICDCLEDGIRKLSDGPFWQYIPDLNWNVVQKNMGSSPVFEHLIGAVSEDGPTQAADTGKTMTEVVLELLDVDPSEFSVDVPFTAYGLDSLSAARLAFALKPFVTISQLQLLSDVTLSDLQARIEKAKEATTATEDNSTSPPAELSLVDTQVAAMEKLIAKYTANFPKHIPSNLSSSDGDVILITGTTGAIGTSVLAQLADMPSVARIYALNRASSDDSSTLHERQTISLKTRGYDPSILYQGKIVLVEGDQAKHDLGITPKLFEEIRSSVTVIVHNAWPVNFTVSLSSFEPSIRSVRVFIDLALGSPKAKPPRILFLSSIGLFYSRTDVSPAPEDSIKDGREVVGAGYSESKWVGERILETASQETPIRPIIVRAGQICGGPNGYWNTTEWFPTLVKSAIHLGSLPSADGNISWVPLHTAARVLVEMLHADRQIMHLSHPRPVPWTGISQFLSKSLNLPLIPYGDWLARLEASAGEGASTGHESDANSNPALRLLHYFRALEIGTNMAKEALGLPRLSVVEGMKVSATLRSAEPLTMMDAARWINTWEKAGFLRI